MARHKHRIFEPRFFGLIIGLAVVLAFLLLGLFTSLFSSMELKVLDLMFFLKNVKTASFVQEGVSVTESDSRKSEDIAIIGIDSRTLDEYGRWPFQRSRFADLVNNFSRIKDQSRRESSMLLDVFFVEPGNAVDDALLDESVKDSGRVFLETLSRQNFPPSIDEDEYWSRLDGLSKDGQRLVHVSGDLDGLQDNLGLEAPLLPLAKGCYGYGHANYDKDSDKIFRRQALVTKISRLLETIDMDSVTSPGDLSAGEGERFAWMDNSGRLHGVKLPLDAKTLASLKSDVRRRSPPRIEDTNGDGTPDTKVFVLKKFRDYLMPSITLSLAVKYFNKTFDDVTVALGKEITIPSPQKWNEEKGAWEPYFIQDTPDKFDDEGNLVAAGKRHVVKDIRIPIDANANMLVNFIGNPSSEQGQGHQTFPVYSMSTYTERITPADSSLWPKGNPNMAARNKILMVGAFSQGLAQDEKPTPFGLMYGIEIHANALNTIVMDNFIHKPPAWINALILVLLVFSVAILSSRLPSIWSLVSGIAGFAVLFFAFSLLFDISDLWLDFASPALAMFLTFISIFAYRIMTEEKDKRFLRETFGKYVSPKVVDQLVDEPPELGGLDRELTVFFSDIRGFSTLSENMTPQELVNHLNVYLAAMTDILLDHGGTLDKYIGDAVMAFWGAPLSQPDHAFRACNCALDQMEKLHELNRNWPPEKRINIGIGLNSGIMTVGNMGSPLRMNYTIMGDNVNLGSRLEGTNKEYGTNVIISEYTWGLVKDSFIFRELDNVRVKGKNKPVGIYELVDRK